MSLKSMIRQQTSEKLLLKLLKPSFRTINLSTLLVVKFHLMCSLKDGTKVSVLNLLKESMMKSTSLGTNVSKEATIMRFTKIQDALGMQLLALKTLLKY